MSCLKYRPKMLGSSGPGQLIRKHVDEIEIRKRPSTVTFPAQRRELIGPDPAAQAVRQVLEGRVQESIVVLHLDARYRLIGFEEVARGTGTSVSMSPKDVFRGALCSGTAQAIVLAHNHPSGDHTPSDEDVALTSSIVRAGNMLGIEVLDHLVVSDTGYTSIAETAPASMLGLVSILGLLALTGLGWLLRGKGPAA